MKSPGWQVYHNFPSVPGRSIDRNSSRLIICGRTRMERDADALYCILLRVQRDAQLLFQPFPAGEQQFRQLLHLCCRQLVAAFSSN